MKTAIEVLIGYGLQVPQKDFRVFQFLDSKKEKGTCTPWPSCPSIGLEVPTATKHKSEIADFFEAS